MLARLTHTRLLRYAGLFTWGLLGCWLLSIWLDPGYFQLEPGQSLFGVDDFGIRVDNLPALQRQKRESLTP